MKKVYFIGCGLGNPDTMTVAAVKAVADSQLLIGAPRLVEPYKDGTRSVAELTRAADIEAALRASDAQVACVLLSGDVGFYSGATGLYSRLEDFEIVVIPGISSLVYFCSQLHTTWQDAFLVSAHGRSHNAIGEIQCHPKTFLLTGGATLVRDICQQMVERGMGDRRVAVGERLSYPDERITRGTAEELAGTDFDTLAVMLVENDAPIVRPVQAPALSDEAFERAKVPMTKEELRELSVCKLQVPRNATVWDVGAGTGSISCEAAFAACAGQVFAIEKNPEALELIARNKDRLGLTNLRVVAGMAPDALDGLPAPDCVFVGGSTGQLQAIVRYALDLNPVARVVVSAITLETVAEALECVKNLPLTDVDICQVQVSRGREAGRYHLMTAQNPVYLVSARGVAPEAAAAEGADGAAAAEGAVAAAATKPACPHAQKGENA